MKFYKTVFALMIVTSLEWHMFAQAPSGGREQPDLFHLYAESTGKTALYPGMLPAMPASLLTRENETPAMENSELIARMEAEFSKAKLEVIPDGKLFVWIVPAGLSNSPMIKTLAAIPKPSVQTVPQVASGANIPAGMIDFINTPLEQCLAVYSDFRQRTLLRPAMLPPVSISLRTQTSLTREEALYAMRVVFVLNGLGLIDDGDSFVQVVPLRTADQVQPGAPAPDPAEPLIEPAKIPRIGFMSLSAAKPVPPTAETLLAFYADVAGRKAVQAGPVGNTRIIFSVQTQLRRNELLYAIKTTLALNGLRVVEEGDSVRLERISH